MTDKHADIRFLAVMNICMNSLAWQYLKACGSWVFIIYMAAALYTSTYS